MCNVPTERIDITELYSRYLYKVQATVPCAITITLLTLYLQVYQDYDPVDNINKSDVIVAYVY